MEYQDAVEVLFDLHQFDPDRSLEEQGLKETENLLRELGNPHDRVPCIQIAGSNGKGSTACMLKRILRESGLDVGLYTSPHLEDVRERIQINDIPISEESVVSFIERVLDYLRDRSASGLSPTFFETLTTLALWEFDRKDVDMAVLEVGLGGRYDATSVVNPLAAAVTSVTKEHTDILGETVCEIAREKAQVAPDGGPMITAANRDALETIRDEVDTAITVGRVESTVDHDKNRETPDIRVAYKGRIGLEGAITISDDDWSLDARLALLGPHQATNAGVAVALARQVAEVSDRQICSGLRNARWPGRFEVVDQEPLVVLDSAHNPASCEQTIETLSSFEYDALRLVVGIMSDKDHQEMALALDPANYVTVCEPENPRSEDADVLAAVFDEQTDASITICSDVSEAVSKSIERANSSDCVLIVGSLFAVAEARRCFGSSSLIAPANYADQSSGSDSSDIESRPQHASDGRNA
ncbi:bifunctional folylpolyglutamate synthase/dihydrofolate synthase [Halorubrum vacuolatum]|uniref:Probable bifunctional folylpolyglutamate synthase/dihydropteroate synthase n=1 Tax=Halorubrum vacuolatum TaxID=63740 RepID=A0A238Y7S8_HALVU|nr:folylpolyglutamate synthase/dihydrofolate synthase family protein [Halorubrum vacuolatum]SNR66888.1 folylpolyglutamate synthase/dihydrofolate synthase [Halorubrum vacuolatum]